jgi:hypothetical protein
MLVIFFSSGCIKGQLKSLNSQYFRRIHAHSGLDFRPSHRMVANRSKVQLTLLLSLMSFEQPSCFILVATPADNTKRTGNFPKCNRKSLYELCIDSWLRYD